MVNLLTLLKFHFLKILIILIFLFSWNCASNRVQTSLLANNSPYVNKKQLTFYLWGILPRYRYTFQELCGDSYLHSFTFERDGLSVISGMLTLGLVSTGNIIYSCYEDVSNEK